MVEPQRSSLNRTGSTLRHLDDKQATSTRFTLDAYPTTVGLDDALHDGQAQPIAIALGTAVAVEALKDVGQRLRVDAIAAIAYPEFYAAVPCPGTQGHMATGRRELESIV